ncbi:MAG TPA: LCP family protein, partial [Propionibacteriaceae bacterium]|nr:LCP family protein [Propionibacteriaceae bacterium]
RTGVLSRSQATVFRRGATMLAMSLVLPGSAQLAAGSRRIGRWGVRVWILGVAALLLALLLLLAARNLLLTVLTTGWVLWVGSWLVLAAGLFWAFLLVNAWWAARPKDMGTTRAAVLGGLALVLAVVISYGTVLTSSALRASADVISTVLGGGGDKTVKDGRYNILLLGSDAGNDREGARTDSVTIASVDARTGRTVLFGLPRNLEDVPFPESSPLHALYPNGYGCESHECMLNAIYKLGQDNKKLYPGVKDPGLQAVEEAVQATTGLELNYYAMVDMFGFKDLIDALGGITMDINIQVPVGGDQATAKSYIEPGPSRHLSGAEALWFSRQRTGSTDYARMQRQKCVMSAMLHQMEPMTVATKFSQIAAATGQVVVTDIPSDQVGTLAELAVKARSLDIKNVIFAPPLIASGSPNFSLIRQTVAEQIAASEALDAAAKSTKPSAAPTTAAPTTAAPTKAPVASATAAVTGKKSAFVNESVAPTSDSLAGECAAR